MSLANLYAQQYQWRRWSDLYPYLGDLSGKHLIDLGCGIGDQVRDLCQRSAHVIGIDGHPEMIAYASARGLPGAHFICDRITNLADHALLADGIWTSFTAAYFPQFDVLLRSISTALKPGGWLAITELDDLFGHAPLDARWHQLVERYYAQSLAEGIYRFRSRDHVRETLVQHGWTIEAERTVADDEFCFSGPALPEVVEAWRQRLAFMMPRFQERFGEAAAGFDAAFLQCIVSAEHHAASRVWFILARGGASSP